MKQNKCLIVSLALAAIFAMSVLLSGCTAQNQPDSSQESSSSESSVPDSSSQSESSSESSSVPESEGSSSESSEPSPAEIAELSEKAMDSFLEKISKGHYVMKAGEYLTTNVTSKDLVFFDYTDNERYFDYAVMSVNDEVFQGYIEGDTITEVTFIKEGKAIEAASGKLPASWLSEEVSGGNIYNIFYNDPEVPYKFVSYDPGVQTQVLSLSGYGETALPYIHEVYLTLDGEEPTQARLQAQMDDDEVARYYFDDIDIVVTFEESVPDERVAAWMENPTYPEARTEWTEGDLFVFNSVFLPGYGEEAIPFMPFASYALSIDDSNFVMDDAVFMRDPHATQEDMAAYVEILKENGFEAAEEEGKTYYRKLLRDETKCSASILLEYNDGLDVTAKKHYEFPTYEGFETINGLIEESGYPALSETEALTDFTATDRKFALTESWMYFFDYETVLYVDAHYTDAEAVMANLENYGQVLTEAGIEPVYVEGESGEIDHYASANNARTFWYHFGEEEGVVTLLYRVEKSLSLEEVQAILEREEMPAIDPVGFEAARDLTKFEKVMYGKTYDTSFTLTMRFSTAQEAEDYLDEYVGLLQEQDFGSYPPSMMTSNKERAFINEQTGKGIAFDYYPGEDGGESQIYFDIKTGIVFDTAE